MFKSTNYCIQSLEPTFLPKKNKQNMINRKKNFSIVHELIEIKKKGEIAKTNFLSDILLYSEELTFLIPPKLGD